MTNVRLIADIGNAEVLAIFWAALVFCVVYWITARWWETAMGRLIFILDASLCLTLSHGAIVRMAGIADNPSPFWTWFAICSLAPVPFAIFSRLLLLLREQYGPKDDEGRHLWTIRNGGRWVFGRCSGVVFRRKRV